MILTVVQALDGARSVWTGSGQTYGSLESVDDLGSDGGLMRLGRCARCQMGSMRRIVQIRICNFPETMTD